MKSILDDLSVEEQQALFPKAMVAVSLYRTHSAKLAVGEIRELIDSLDKEVGTLLRMIYDSKHLSRSQLMKWVKYQDQQCETIHMEVSEIEHVRAGYSELDAVEMREHISVGLFAQGQGKIYKRTLDQDLDTLLK